MVNGRAETLKKVVDEQVRVVANCYKELQPPRLPKELVAKIISFLPDSMSKAGSGFSLDIFGWLPHMCISPSLPLLLRIYLYENHHPDKVASQLRAIAGMKSIYFSVEINTRSTYGHVQNLRILLQHPHRWRRLFIHVYDDVNCVSGVLQDVAPCFPFLDWFKLAMYDDARTTQTDWNSILNTECLRLAGHPKIVCIEWPLLHPFLNINSHYSVRELRLYIDRDIDRFSECLHLLSELPCLEELSVQIWDENMPEEIFVPVQPVRLRGLELTGNNENQITSCLKLFKGSFIHDVTLAVSTESSEELIHILNESLPLVRQIKLAPYRWVRIEVSICILS